MCRQALGENQCFWIPSLLFLLLHQVWAYTNELSTTLCFFTRDYDMHLYNLYLVPTCKQHNCLKAISNTPILLQNGAVNNLNVENDKWEFPAIQFFFRQLLSSNKKKNVFKMILNFSVHSQNVLTYTLDRLHIFNCI